MRKRSAATFSLILSLALLGSCSASEVVSNSMDRTNSHISQNENPQVNTKEVRYARTYTDAGFADDKDMLLSQVQGDLTYRIDSMKDIASVSDTVVIGTFKHVNSAVEGEDNFKTIITTGTLDISETLIGNARGAITVKIAGGTVPYSDIRLLYSEENLAKYNIDPENPKYETMTQYFENMVPFSEGQTYLVTLSEGNGVYYINPSLYSLASLMDPSSAESERTSAKAAVFSIEEYLESFQD